MRALDQINEYMKWYYYSTYHPSWGSNEVLRDFRNGLSIREAYEARGLTWDPPKKD